MVEDGLAWAGFEMLHDERVALTETARPHSRPYRTLLAQSAWNVVPAAEFRERLSPYPRAMWARTVARRAVAQLNLRRADRVVCLSEAMATLCARFNDHIVVAPVTVPSDCIEVMARLDGEVDSSTLLVPGTVTWYKNPHAALNLHAERQDWSTIVFAGRDDGSGCWPAVASEASRRGIAVRRRELSRREMIAACSSAGAMAVLSRLESLSFSMAEALLLSDAVFASPITAHREIATRLGRNPTWVPAGSDRSTPRSPMSRSAMRGEWQQLGRSLGLEPSERLQA